MHTNQPDKIREEHVHVRVALNGRDYTEQNENTYFTFFGTGTMLMYWPYILIGLLLLLVLIGLILCCSQFFAGRAAEPAAVNANAQPGRRAHAFRNDAGMWVTGGLLPTGQKKRFGGSQYQAGPPEDKKSVDINNP